MSIAAIEKRVGKAYGQLSPQEQAALAFEAASRHDWKGVDAVLAAVPREHYRSVHIDYRRRAAGLQALAGVYGIAYWKNIALAYICQTVGAQEECGKFLARSNSVEKALAVACERYGVSAEAFRDLAECLPPFEFPEYLDDKDITGRFVELFTSAVEP